MSCATSRQMLSYPCKNIYENMFSFIGIFRAAHDPRGSTSASLRRSPSSRDATPVLLQPPRAVPDLSQLHTSVHSPKRSRTRQHVGQVGDFVRHNPYFGIG